MKTKQQSKPKKDRTDEALTLGLRKYRELYPVGAVPAAVEEQASLNVWPGNNEDVVVMAYWLKDQVQPFVFFQAEVARDTGKVEVLVAQPAASISLDELAPLGDEPAHISASGSIATN